MGAASFLVLFLNITFQAKKIKGNKSFRTTLSMIYNNILSGVASPQLTMVIVFNRSNLVHFILERRVGRGS